MSVEHYSLYVGNNCKSCEGIEQFIANQNISIQTINIDEEEYNLPFSLMVIPALVKEGKLIGYGPDIIPYLTRLSA